MYVPLMIVLLVLVLTIAGFIAISLFLVYVIYKLKLAEKAKDLEEYEKRVSPLTIAEAEIPKPPEVIEVPAF